MDDEYYYSSEESALIPVLKGIIGAVIGAVPGIILWVLIGKMGFIASVCGLILSAGIVFGYSFLTKKESHPVTESAAIPVCLIVMIAAVYIAQRLVWSWIFAEAFEDFYPRLRAAFIEEAYSVGTELSKEEISAVITDEMLREIAEENYGVSDFSFESCFINFSKMLDMSESAGSEFISSMVQSYIFAAVGVGAGLAKAMQK